MNRLLHIVLLTALAMSLLVAACGDNSCYENGSSLPLATFYVGNTQQSISRLTVMGIGVPGDSLLLDGGSADEMYLPLQAGATTTSFLFRRQFVIGTDTVTIKDTVTIDYQSVEYFHSAECGAMFNFNVKGVRWTENAIDSVVLLNKVITNAPLTSLRIHFTNYQL